MTERTCLSIVLAAGEGTRMKSAKPKVLHEVAGLSMVGHVLRAVAAAGGTAAAVIVGPDREDVAAEVRRQVPDATIHVQRDRLGTAHAVLHACEVIARGFDDVIVAFGDTPLVTPETFARLRAALRDGAAVAVLGFEAADPFGYGRLVMEGGTLASIVEEKDASEAERAITLCNGGLMALRGDGALALLERIGNANAKGEYYLTDAVALARAAGLATAIVLAPEEEVRGVNDRVQLAEVEAIAQGRLRVAAMRGGVTMAAPETVFLAYDTVLGRDVSLEPHVVFGPGVTIADDVTIRAYSHLAGCTVAAGAIIGPFARIRPKSRIGEKVHIGNFVEVNRTSIAAKAEANHLAYLGDATIGEGTNIGAGTITCNFDGADKHPTVIGRDVFVGSNSTLVAPLTIGDEVLIAAGSTITLDAKDGALVFGRAKQAGLPGRGAERIRLNKERRAARKAKEQGKG
ncbi:bifunctional UDP-N-acetylglucosamine diphosphorylase/glucosamine-1-phosphate N-acetyltransferase GlmU [Phreatobacter sp.]|uniref:bifunctional UDP-N-acetylglucosamine diphosphorylase/glucosamine-1-phosphate N-acetyltransferase GlmU n=1 Tax=Phreatobacter sp. TaxID=1966341 RepID=UPI0022CA415F|nr:bifunctional UDP-N-acetylglucosamine diphosphorylase/glucosamine-1-phosphate N-acetyltransferase GlmU [Phreatobacter sp.]MCZ8315026.1 bifunctional UDP-N-acetylglucosamine diphosphorylase/glucosamine-1-phosphate N-acetyltransferase GlmU [Phreatobacter sp.]